MAFGGLQNMKFFVISVNMLFPVFASLNKEAFGYNNFVLKGILTCFQRNRCSEITNTTMEGTTCQCDTECSKFGDCCIDAARLSSKKILPQKCMFYGNSTAKGMYMVNSCPIGYVGLEVIRRQCLNDDFSDIAKSAPVTDFVNRQIYLNRYCAICNDVPLIFVKAWAVSRCIVDNSTVKNVSLADLTYVTDKKWGYEINGQFHQCKFVFEKPPTTPPIGRSCRLDYVSSCATNWTKEGFDKACESYIAVVKDSNGIVYKNPHCAICNGVSLRNVACVSRARRDFTPSLLLNINKVFGANRPVPYIPPPRLCPEGQIYDPYFRKCRTLVCAVRGYSIRNGRCRRNW